MSQADPLIAAIIGQVENGQVSGNLRVTATLEDRTLTGRVLRASEYREKLTKLAMGQRGPGAAVVRDALDVAARESLTRAIRGAMNGDPAQPEVQAPGVAPEYLHLLIADEVLERVRIDRIEAFGTHLASTPTATSVASAAS